jgi:hypothetical protein
MKKSHLLVAFCITANMTVAAVPAYAATIGWGMPFSASRTTSVVFDLFDPTLGTLTDVRLFINSSASNTVEGDIYFPTTVYDGLQPLINSQITVNVSSTTIGNGFKVVPGAFKSCTLTSGGCTWFPTTRTDYVDGDFFGEFGLNPNLAAFIGPGTFGVDLSISSFITDCGPSGTTTIIPTTNCFSHSENWSGNFSFVYEYNPVPVPAAGWLFGSGLIGLIGVARRKKA